MLTTEIVDAPFLEMFNQAGGIFKQHGAVKSVPAHSKWFGTWSSLRSLLTKTFL